MIEKTHFLIYWSAGKYQRKYIGSSNSRHHLINWKYYMERIKLFSNPHLNLVSVKYQLNHAASISDNTKWPCSVQIIITYLCMRFHDLTHMSCAAFLGMGCLECALCWAWGVLGKRCLAHELYWVQFVQGMSCLGYKWFWVRAILYSWPGTSCPWHEFP